MPLTLVNAYICANVLLIVAAVWLTAMDARSAGRAQSISYRRLLQIGRAILIAAILLPLSVHYAGKRLQAPHAAEVWSAPTMRAQGRAALDDHRVAVVVTAEPVSVPLDSAALAAGLAVALGLIVMMVRVAKRLDVTQETDAAVRLFNNLQKDFDDWSLTLLAFNVGGPRVEEGIRRFGSRDVWQLIEHGYENDAEYLPRALAIMVILRNPTVVRSLTEG